jgi:hypothetical protein
MGTPNADYRNGCNASAARKFRQACDGHPRAPTDILLFAIIVCLGIALVWTLWEIEHDANPRHDRHRSD